MKINKICLLLVLVMLFSLCACGKDSAVLEAEAAISAIGDITIDSQNDIAKAQEFYDALTTEQKDSVKNVDVLTEANEIFDELINEAVSPIVEDIRAMNDALLEADIEMCYASIDAFKEDFENLPPAAYEAASAVILTSTGEDDMTYLEFLDKYEETVESMCIHGTMFAFPGLVVSNETEGMNLVNDRGSFATYNTWFDSEDKLNASFNEYKEYIEKHGTITEEDQTSFTAVDINENCVTVISSISHSSYILRVRIPRF